MLNEKKSLLYIYIYIHFPGNDVTTFRTKSASITALDKKSLFRPHPQGSTLFKSNSEKMFLYKKVALPSVCVCVNVNEGGVNS